MAKLIWHSTPAVTFGSNVFINVPTILQFDATPLISVVKEMQVGYTTEIPVYDRDGTYLAKVRGTRVYATGEGKEHGVEIRKLSGCWICSVKGRTAFEIHQEPGQLFLSKAELYAPGGYLVRVEDGPTPELFDVSGQALQIRGAVIRDSLFQNCRIGVWLQSDGRLTICV